MCSARQVRPSMSRIDELHLEHPFAGVRMLEQDDDGTTIATDLWRHAAIAAPLVTTAIEDLYDRPTQCCARQEGPAREKAPRRRNSARRSTHTATGEKAASQGS